MQGSSKVFCSLTVSKPICARGGGITCNTKSQVVRSKMLKCMSNVTLWFIEKSNIEKMFVDPANNGQANI